MDNDDWLIRQLEAWPTRVDAERTIEVRHLMQEAAQSLRSLHSALQGAVIWHQNADKALSKQPPSADGQWRRMEHQEQASNLAALATQPATSQEGEDHGLGPHAAVVEDGEDGFMPVAIVVGSNVYLSQGGRQLTMSTEQFAEIASHSLAATPTPPTLSEDLREALEEISEAHLGDQPATSDDSDYEWAVRHIRRLRGIARAALAQVKAS